MGLVFENGEFDPAAIPAGRGNWSGHKDPQTAMLVFSGYGGENALTVHYSGMQSGVMDVMIVEWRIDDYLKFHRMPLRLTFMEAERWIDSTLRELMGK